MKKRWYVLVFVLSSLILLIDYFCDFSIHLLVDDFGGILLPAKLAGLEWQDVTLRIPYYGWGYYIIFAPILYFVKNPYLINFILCSTNICLIGASGVIVLAILDKYIRIESKIMKILIAVLSTTYTTVFTNIFNAEPPAFFFMWLVIFLVVYCTEAKNVSKKNIATICLLVALIVALNIHTRLVILMMGISIAVILSYVFYKKWIVNPMIFFGGEIGAFVIARVLKEVVVNYVWNGKDASELINATLISRRAIGLNNTVEVFFDLVVSNFYKLFLETKGIVLVCFIVIFSTLISVIKKRYIEKQTYNNIIHSNKLELIIACIGVVCLCATIMAIPLYMGSGVARGYEQGVENNRFTAFTYLRYYYLYFSPVFVAAISLILKKSVEIKRLYFSLVIASGVLIFCVWIGVIPNLIGTYYQLIFCSFIVNDPYRVNFAITGLILFAFVLLWGFLIRKQKEKLIIFILSAFMLITTMNKVDDMRFEMAGASNANALYEIYMNAEAQGQLPDEIYMLQTRNVQMDIQFMLNQYAVISDYPADAIEQAVVLTTEYDLEECEQLVEDGFQYWILDSNECLWIKGENLTAQLEPHIIQYITQKNEIENGQINLGLNTRRLFGTIWQKESGIAASATIAEPVYGEYVVGFSMDILKNPTEVFGSIDIIADGVVVYHEDLTTKDMDRIELQIPLYVDEIDSLQIQCSLNQDVIIKDLDMYTQCLEYEKVVGKYHTEELEVLRSLINQIDVDIPIKLIGYNNPYSMHSDTGYLAEIMEVEEIEVMDSSIVGEKRLQENCYILLQNSNELPLLFDLVNEYNIIWKTQNYTLLIYNNEQNRRMVEESECVSLSKNGKIDINYFRLDANGNLMNDRSIPLPKGAYEVTTIQVVRGTPEKQDQFSINVLDRAGAVSYIYQMTENEAENSILGEQVIVANGETAYSFNWNYNALIGDASSNAYIERCYEVYEAGGIIDFSTTGERPFYYTGIGGAEEWGAWSTELENIIELNVKCKDTITLDITMRAYVEQDVTVSVNGTEFTVLPVGESVGTYSVTIPKGYLEDGTLELTLSVSQLCSPNERTGSPDMRKLGIGISQIEFK